MIRITECPRDAMQGLSHYIPAKVKAEYINLLLKTGFDTVDFGSFVSPQAVPQMRDTAEVLDALQLEPGGSKLLAITANRKGIDMALTHERINVLGFPFSISETFQRKNTNSSISESLGTVAYLVDACAKTNREPLVYLSMAFGNPYGDEWSTDIAAAWTGQLVSTGVKTIALSDTTGVSDPANINSLYAHLSAQFPEADFGVHLHSRPEDAAEKVRSAWRAGCRRFDAALRGFGGCPMAEDHLTGNIATEVLISSLRALGENVPINEDAFSDALAYSTRIFTP